MFEQSLLLDHAAGKKTGALAASLTVQTLAVGVMIAIPLIFSDHLPGVRLLIPLSLPSPPPPLPPATQAQASSSHSSNPTALQARIFRPPTHITPLSEMPSVVEADAPALTTSACSNCVPGGTGEASAFIEQIIKPIVPVKPNSPEAAPALIRPITVSQGVQQAKLIKRVIPVYPPLAKQARISGTVRLIGIIAKDGTMRQLQLVSGHPLLVQSALDAVRQWIYRPTLLNGQAVEVVAPIDVNFTLSQ